MKQIGGVTLGKLTLLALAQNEERGIYHGFKIDSEVIMRLVRDYIHSREWPKVWEGSLHGAMADLSPAELSELIPPPPGPEPMSEPNGSHEPGENAGLVTA